MDKEIRIIKSCEIEDAVKNLFLKIGKTPSDDVVKAVEKAYERETNTTAKCVLKQLCDNKKISDEKDMPYCQDTGMAVVFIDIGKNVIVDGDIDEAVNNGVKKAYKEGYLRKSVLDPITRINTGDNTPAIIHKDINGVDKIRISGMAKGFGSENMGQLRMLKPSDGVDGIINFILEVVDKAGGSPCPPVILGVGIGGTLEKAAIISKKQLLRNLEDKNKDEYLADLEKRIMDKINSRGIGAMGFKGDTYCLGVKIGKYPTHLAGLPVCVTINCHASRHGSCEL